MKPIPMILCAALAACLLTCPAGASVPGEGEILAASAVLMDAGTGQVLYEKNAHSIREPASITKILTGLLVLENLEEDALLTASDRAVDIPAWGSSAYLEAGERLTVRDALYAMMLKSANEAANVLAEEVAGSMEEFAERMNERARELGAENTHFTNASGLPDRRHVTTAYDMAMITRKAVDTPGFGEYFGAERYTMSPTNRAGARTFTNTHRMLRGEYAVNGGEVTGGKTGYTVPAGYTLVTVARGDDRTLICVVMGSGSYYADTQALLDFGFGEFISYTYAPDGPGAAEVPILDGEREAGRASFSLASSIPLLLHESVDPDNLRTEYRLPDRLGPGEEARAAAVVYADGAGGLPDPLITVPMAASVTAYAPPPVVRKTAQTSRPRPGTVLPGALAAAVVAAVLAIGAAAPLNRRQYGSNRKGEP